MKKIHPSLDILFNATFMEYFTLQNLKCLSKHTNHVSILIKQSDGTVEFVKNASAAAKMIFTNP